MTKVKTEIEHEPQTVGGVDVYVIELVWDDGGRSFDVYRAKDGMCLTGSGSFDAMPTTEQIQEVLENWFDRVQVLSERLTEAGIKHHVDEMANGRTFLMLDEGPRVPVYYDSVRGGFAYGSDFRFLADDVAYAVARIRQGDFA